MLNASTVVGFVGTTRPAEARHFYEQSLGLELVQKSPFALALIDVCKVLISPYKSFACPYRLETGLPSCSTFGYRAIRRYGVIRGAKVLRVRTSLCAL